MTPQVSQKHRDLAVIRGVPILLARQQYKIGDPLEAKSQYSGTNRRHFGEAAEKRGVGHSEHFRRERRVRLDRRLDLCHVVRIRVRGRVELRRNVAEHWQQHLATLGERDDLFEKRNIELGHLIPSRRWSSPSGRGLASRGSERMISSKLVSPAAALAMPSSIRVTRPDDSTLIVRIS